MAIGTVYKVGNLEFDNWQDAEWVMEDELKAKK